MVSRVKEENDIYFRCEECGLTYEEKELAKKCESWCSEHQSCNMEITSYSMEARQ